jgi:two-component system LytT family response regulator
MSKTKIVIVDDESESRESLKYLIENNFNDVEISGVANSVNEAKEIITSNEPDIVYLDIMMPGMDGFSLISLFPERTFEVIVTSASTEFGIQGIKHGAIDYILKPATVDDLSTSLDTYKKNKLKPAKDRIDINDVNKIAITTSDGFQLENLDNVVRLEADSNYTTVHLSDKRSLLVSKSLKEFEKSFEGIEHFTRIHKSHLININYVKNFSTIDGGFVSMSDGSSFPVSKRKNPDFFKALSKVSLMLKP